MALFFRNFIAEHTSATAELLDLNEYRFPIFEERLSGMKKPSPELLEFAEKIETADAVIIVTPEYNGGYPASLKNAIDVLYKEWKRKPVAVASASAGPFGGTQVITSLVFTLWKIGACLIPAMYLGTKVQDNYTETGIAINKDETEKRARIFIDEVLQYISHRQGVAV